MRAQANEQQTDPPQAQQQHENSPHTHTSKREREHTSERERESKWGSPTSKRQKKSDRIPHPQTKDRRRTALLQHTPQY
jgi:hypothetical protein